MRVRALVEVEVEDPNPNPKWKTEQRGREKHGRHEEEGNTRMGMNRDEPGGNNPNGQDRTGACAEKNNADAVRRGGRSTGSAAGVEEVPAPPNYSSG